MPVRYVEVSAAQMLCGHGRPRTAIVPEAKVQVSRKLEAYNAITPERREFQ